ncbi:unnamed protein product [Prunus armeniaca]
MQLGDGVCHYSFLQYYGERYAVRFDPALTRFAARGPIVSIFVLVLHGGTASTTTPLCGEGVVAWYQATNEEIDMVNHILDLYAKFSWQQGRGFGKYLGLQSEFGHSKKVVFEEIREKVEARVHGWAENFLTMAGKEGSQGTGKGLHWAKLKTLAQRKDCGGLGFKDLFCFNRAMLAKIGWRLLSQPSSLLHQVLQAKYFPNGSFMEAQLGRKPSWGWRSILKGWQEEADSILAMALSRFGCSDCLMWHFTKDGLYTVKSGRGDGGTSVDRGGRRLWKSIWELNIVGKIRHFIWRCCQNYLAVQCNLRQRGGTFANMWLELCDRFAQESRRDELLRSIAYGLWRLWKCRNSLVFEGIPIHPVEAVKIMIKQQTEFLQTREKGKEMTPIQGGGGEHRSMGTQQWSCPLMDFVKISCDEAWTSQTLHGGWGWVIRDASRVFKGARGEGGVRCGTAIVVEAEALRAGLCAGVDQGWQWVVLESDSKLMIDMLKGVGCSDSRVEDAD